MKVSAWHVIERVLRVLLGIVCLIALLFYSSGLLFLTRPGMSTGEAMPIVIGLGLQALWVLVTLLACLSGRLVLWILGAIANIAPLGLSSRDLIHWLLSRTDATILDYLLLCSDIGIAIAFFLCAYAHWRSRSSQ